ncbi:uncharacterized protein LOC142348737 isoform X2 [Convolutriloba macropyga]|uniref:uncharacterized protein LOC142348737 isoform X2 n=1 Tax=Convolutriloba macropyga TaxID=536237 RepID=UPI003F5278B4
MQGNRGVTEVSLKDITGCHHMRGNEKLDLKGYFRIYCYRLSKKSGRRERESITFVFDKGDSEENWKTCTLWHKAVNLLLRGVTDITRDRIIGKQWPEKKVLVIINPASGRKKGMQTYWNIVAPMLVEASYKFRSIVTTGPGHASQVIMSENLSKWTSILLIGGDGILFEVVNALMKRPDWKRAIETPLGLIPAGSGNGLVATILHEKHEMNVANQQVNSMFRFLKGQPRPLDLTYVKIGQQEYYSFLSVSWGALADVDINSEVIRFMGESRFTLWALGKIISNDSYKAKLRFVEHKSKEPFNAIEIVREIKPKPVEKDVYSDTIMVDDGAAAQRVASSSGLANGCVGINDGDINIEQDQYEEELYRLIEEGNSQETAPSERASESGFELPQQRVTTPTNLTNIWIEEQQTKTSQGGTNMTRRTDRRKKKISAGSQGKQPLPPSQVTQKQQQPNEAASTNNPNTRPDSLNNGTSQLSLPEKYVDNFQDDFDKPQTPLTSRKPPESQTDPLSSDTSKENTPSLPRRVPEPIPEVTSVEINTVGEPHASPSMTNGLPETNKGNASKSTNQHETDNVEHERKNSQQSDSESRPSASADEREPKLNLVNHELVVPPEEDNDITPRATQDEKESSGNKEMLVNQGNASKRKRGSGINPADLPKPLHSNITRIRAGQNNQASPSASNSDLTILSPNAQASHMADSSIYPKVSIAEFIPSYPEEKWQTENSEDFFFILASNVTHIGSDMCYAPQAKPNDGCMQLGYCLQPISRANLLKLTTKFSDGSHINCPEMMFKPVKAFEIEFDQVSEEMNLVVDGEKVPNAAKISCTVLPSLARFIY